MKRNAIKELKDIVVKPIAVPVMRFTAIPASGTTKMTRRYQMGEAKPGEKRLSSAMTPGLPLIQAVTVKPDIVGAHTARMKIGLLKDMGPKILVSVFGIIRKRAASPK